MNPVTILLISISVILLAVVAFIPFIMTILSPHNLPDHLSNYYSSNIFKTTFLGGLIMFVIILAIWLFAYCFGLL